jgi:hypothetical protein
MADTTKFTYVRRLNDNRVTSNVRAESYVFRGDCGHLTTRAFAADACPNEFDAVCDRCNPRPSTIWGRS